MKKWSDLGVPHISRVGFIGEKIPIAKLINKDVYVLDFKIEKSKKKEGTDCLVLQIKYQGDNRVVFTGAKILIQQIMLVDKKDLPFMVKIEQEEDNSYIFV